VLGKLIYFTDCLEKGNSNLSKKTTMASKGEKISMNEKSGSRCRGLSGKLVRELKHLAVGRGEGNCPGGGRHSDSDGGIGEFVLRRGGFFFLF